MDFLRDQDNLVGLSRALANHGIQVVTLDFCNMRLWNGNHESNGLDMRALAQKLRMSDNIIYGGFSAGALAAVLAADDDTRAILALDLVDQNDLGLKRHSCAANTADRHIGPRIILQCKRQRRSAFLRHVHSNHCLI